MAEERETTGERKLSAKTEAMLAKRRAEEERRRIEAQATRVIIVGVRISMMDWVRILANASAALALLGLVGAIISGVLAALLKGCAG